MKLRVNPQLQVSWREGIIVLAVPGQPPMELDDPSGLPLLSEFSLPRDVDDVLGEYEDPAAAAHSVEELFRCGALILSGDQAPLPPDLQREEGSFRAVQERCAPFTMGTPALNYALHKAVEHVVRADIPGDIVESGVWKGGSAMICCLTLLDLGVRDRVIRLYDSFDSSWPEPTREDGTIYGRTYEDTLRMHREGGEEAASPGELAREGLGIDAVRDNLASTGYPMENVLLVEGLVEETLPARAPERISLLRLDTDFYRSTRHELTHLYPLVERGGVLLVDDYPTERGATKAVDEYFRESAEPILLSRVDVQGRIGVRR